MKRKKPRVPEWMRKRQKHLKDQEKRRIETVVLVSKRINSLKRVLTESGLSQKELDFLLSRTVIQREKRDEPFLNPNIPRVRNILSRFPKDQHKDIIRVIESVKWHSEIPLSKAKASAAGARKKRIFLLNQMLEIKGKKRYWGE